MGVTGAAEASPCACVSLVSLVLCSIYRTRSTHPMRCGDRCAEGEATGRGLMTGGGAFALVAWEGEMGGVAPAWCGF